MGPLFPALVWLVVAAHFAFLIYLPVGGFVALRWRRTIWLHLAAVLWGVVTVAMHIDCPLTTIEQWARSRAGLPPLPSTGFIDHYVTGVLYPSGATGYAQAVVFMAVAVSWTVYVSSRRGRNGRRLVGGAIIRPRVDRRTIFPE